MKYKMNDTERAALAELKNAVEVFNAAIAAFDAAVPQCGYGGDGLPPPGLYDRILREVERPLLNLSLAATRGNQIKAASLLGLNRNTLRKKLRELDIQVIRGIK